MQIQPTNGFGNSKQDVAATDNRRSSSAETSLRSDGVHQHAPHARSPEIQQMLDAESAFNEIRDELVSVVKERLANGYYTSPEATAETAAKIVSPTRE